MAKNTRETLSRVVPQESAAKQLAARKRLIAAAISACFVSAPAWSNPSGPQVVNGSASFNQAGSLLTVNNSNGAIINWNSFSVGANETTRFNQASASSSVLNRVIANDPSVLLGTLSSNGRVWLINPAGIMVGQGATIDVAGFVASTLNVANQDFLAGRLNFGATPNAGSVQNYGQITTPSGGSVYLVAPSVTNNGIINAPNGEVILAAGQTVQLIDTGTPGVSVAVIGAKGDVTNLGQIISEAGRIGMAGVLVTNSGTLNASSVVKDGGRIFLKASQNVTLGNSSHISADAGQTGNGGNISALAEGTTYVDGGISARGGSQSGDGGFVETSGTHVKIADSTLVSTLAPGGKSGTWLIDPQNYTVAASGGDETGATLSNGLGGGNVTILSSSGGTAGTGAVIINDTVSWGANTTLTLTASNNVRINNAGITATGASSSLVLNANTANGTETPSGTGIVNITNSYVSIGGPVVVTGTGLSVGTTTATTGATLQGGSMTATLSGSISVVGGTCSVGCPAILGSTAGPQTLSANQVVISGGTSGTNNFAQIVAQGGDQQITLTGTSPSLILTGGGTDVSDFGNWAQLLQQTSLGHQWITINGAGTVQLTGGSGSGLDSSLPSPNSNNSVSIQNNGTRTQLLNFGSGGSLVLMGGSTGSGNGVMVASNAGPQSISGAPAITLTGGTSGTGNGANIYSAADQSISASSLALLGGAGGTTNGVGVMQAPSTGGAQTIAVTGGNISLTGGIGTGNVASIFSGSSTLQSITANGIILQGGAGGSGNFANIGTGSAAAQTVTAASGGIQIAGGAGGSGNTAEIGLYSSGSGTQTIAVTGGDVSVQGGGAGNGANIWSNGTAQSITLTDSNNLKVIAAAGGANIGSQGSQAISLTGSGANAIQVGSASDAAWSSINANGAQSITAGSAGQQGAITLTGGIVAGMGVNIGGGTQTIATSGVLSLTGGSATGGSNPCYDEGVCVSINSNGLQSISAQGIVLQGGATGDNNTVNIGTGTGGQSLTVGSGGVQVLGGAGGTNNFASIGQYDPSGTQTIAVTGGNVSVTGGGGTGDWAQIQSQGTSQSVTLGSGGIQITGGAGGSGNTASINENSLSGTQTIAVTGGIVSVTGGSGSGNWALLDGNNGSGLQSISANGIIVQGGASGDSNNAAVRIDSGSGGQSVTVGSGGIQIAGGTGGSNNWASVGENDPSGTQAISASGIMLTGGAGGTNNRATIGSSGDQQISTSTSAGITIQGGGGTSYGNYAQISHGGSGNQTININGGGSVTLTAGSGTGATSGGNLVPAVCASDPNCASVPVAGDWAGISSGVGNQTLTFQNAGGVLSLTGGSGGNENKAYISNGGSGTQTIAGLPDITLTGGTSGGNNYVSTDGFPYLRNNASLFSPNGAQAIQANSLTLNGMSAGADPGTISNASVYGNGQTITVTNAITLNSGTSSVAYTLIKSPGNQSITAGSIALNAGSGTNDYAQIYGSGDQQISTSTTAGITLQGGGGTSYGNYAQINHSVGGGNQTININGGGSVTIAAGSGTGTTTNNSGLVNGVCAADSNCMAQPVTDDAAGIFSNGGNQTLTFQNAGGVLSLTGGSGGNENKAYISNGGNGTQTIAGFPIITLTGGASGGNSYMSTDGFRYLLNNASLFSPHGAQTIKANSLTLNGMAAGADAATRAGATVIGDGQNITVTNAISLNSGTSSGGTRTLIQSLNGQSIAAESVSLTAGSGTGPSDALIESSGAQSLTVGNGGIQMTGGAGGGNNTASITQNSPTDSQSIAASGGISLTGGGGTNNWVQIYNNGSGVQSISGNGIIVQGGASGTNNTANISNSNNGSGGQSLVAGSGGIQVTGGTAGSYNSAFINQNGLLGTQTIAVTGGDVSVQGGAAGNGANIWSNGTAQSITLTDSNNLKVIAAAGGANINSQGSQTISLTGSGANAIQVGDASDAQFASINANGAQSITAGTGTQLGSITLTGGNVAGMGVNIGGGTQTIASSGVITLTGGSATGGSNPCNDEGVCVGINSNGLQSISANGIVLQGGATGDNNTVNIGTGTGGQSLTVGSGGVQVLGGAGGTNNFASIGQYDPSGTQTIAVTGGDVSVQGGGAGNGANIWSNGTAQSITLTDSNNLKVIAAAGGANIGSQGSQTISLTGTGVNAIQVGDASDAQFASINANGAQSITAGSAGQQGAITLVGGTVAGMGVNIGGGTQTIATSGVLSLTGGSATGGSKPCYDEGVCVSINSNGLQSISAQGIVLQGGATGDNNTVNIGTGTGGQSLTVGSGGVQVLGGAGGTNNFASIGQGDPSGTQTIAVTGGNVSVTGGGGAGNWAQIWSNGTAQSITLTDSNNLKVIAAAGGANINSQGSQTINLTGTGANVIQVGSASDATWSSINANGAQSITAGSAGQQGAITLVGGNVAGNPVTGGAGANIWGGTTQTISTSGVLSLTGGSATTVGTGPCYDEGACVSINNGSGLQSISAQEIVLQGGPTGDYNMVNIGGDSQSFTVGSGGIQIIGGTGGSNNNAGIYQNDPLGTQAIAVTGGNVSVTGGGGTGNWAQIQSQGTSQSVTVGSGGIQIAGGAGGSNNWASVGENDPSGTQTISASGIMLTGGAGGTNNRATIGSSGDQQISTSTSAGITIQGGGGTSYGNYAQISHGGSGNQTININGGGSVTLTAGSGTGATSGGNLVPAVCASDPNCASVPVAGDWAGISSGVGNQTLTFQNAGGVLSLTGGSGGNENKAYISNGGSGTQTIAGLPDITLTGGTSGGNNYVSTDGFPYLRNNASLFSPNGAQAIQANSLTLNGMSAGADPGTISNASVYGNGQTITVTNAITLNSGTSSVAYTLIKSPGNQSITAGSIALNAGSGTNDYAQIYGSGDQQISTSTTAGITLQGGGGTSYGNYAQINHSVGGGNQTININGGGSVTIAAGSGTGTTTNNSGLVNGVCAADSNCMAQPVTDDAAGIFSNGGNQTLTFQNAGGVLSLTGGSGGNENKAYISNGGNGTQTIAGFPIITLTGGASGGNSYMSTDGFRYLLNNASLFSPHGAQTIKANSLTLNGMAAGADAATRAGATVIGDGQNITVTNAISLNSGTSSGGTRTLIQSLNGQSIAAESVSLTAGSGTGPSDALIESSGAQSLTVGNGGIQMTGGAGGGNNTASITQNSPTDSQSIAASGGISLTGGGGTNNWVQIYNNGSGVQSISGNGIIVQGGASGTNNTANISNSNNGSGGQSLVAGSGGIQVTGGTAGSYNSAFINQNGLLGTQTIAVTGGDVSVQGGAAGNGANIWSNGTAQSITLTDSNNLKVIAAAGGANINSQGSQTISLTGSGANAIQVGSASDAAWSSINANGAQSITAGTAAQSGSITLTGGTVAGQDVSIVGPNSGATTQTISTSGVLTLAGGSATAIGTNPCVDEGTCASINSNGTGLQSISANGIIVQGGASGSYNNANIGNGGTGGQSLTVGSGGIQILGATGAATTNNYPSASIGQYNSTGNQTITVAGGDVSVQGGTAGNSAQIWSNGTAQSITLTGSNHLNVIASAGGANINSQGSQTISLTGSGANAIQVGDASDAQFASINANGAQSITAGTGTQLGSITLTGGNVAGMGVNIGGGTQTIASSGVITLTGGSATGGSNPCNDEGVCVGINSNGLQSISANGIVLQGGATGDNNTVNIGTGTGGQSLTVGSGGIQVLGGAGGTNNFASIGQYDPSGTQTIAVTGGNVSVQGGGAGNGANIWSNGTAQSITLTDSNNLKVIAAAGGANIGSQGSQAISLTGSGANAIQVGSASDATWSSINANGAQSITAGSAGQQGAITLVGGNVASNPVTGGAGANIWGGTTQTVSTSGALSLTGGSATTVGTSPCYDEGSCVSINSNGPQSISANGIIVAGGASGIGNTANIGNGAGGQSLTVGSSGIQITGGADGTYNSASINSGGDQQISTYGGIAIQGGGGTSYGNYAQISHGGGGNQTININGDGSVTLTAGSGTEATSGGNLVPAVCASDPNCASVPVAGDWAGISSGVGNQTLTFQNAGGVLSLTGGSGGNENKVYISNGGTGTQTIAGLPDITLTGGASGGNSYVSTDGIGYLRNNASLYSPHGAQMIQASSLTLNGMSAEADAGAQVGASVYGNGQTITVANAITLNSGTSSVAYTLIKSLGNQSITAGSIALNAGSGTGALSGYSGDYAEILAYGSQNITLTGTGPVLTIVGGGGTGGYDNYAGISQSSVTAGSQTITLQGANSTVSLQGGSGSGLGSTSLPSSCYSGGVLTYCDPTLLTSHNIAFINNSYGGQTIDFKQGGSLNLTGGANGVFNFAQINNTSTNGQQVITSSKGSAYYPNITLMGGASGGSIATYGGALAYDAAGVPIYLRNGAWIQSPNATANARQRIDAGTMTLAGAGDSTTFGGAWILGPYQSITSTGNISLTAGAGSDPSLTGLTGAMIGNSEAAADVQVTVGGSLTLQGGTGTGSGALVGSRQFGATVVANVASGISVSAGASGSGPVAAVIGSSEGHGGSVSLEAGQDIVFGDNTGMTNKPRFTPTAPMNVTLLAGRDITLGQVSTDPFGGNVTLMAGWNGNTTTPALATVAPSGGSGGSITMTGASIANAGSVNAQAYGALDLDSISGKTILGVADSGNLTLNSGAILNAFGAVLATGDNFINDAGASALSAPNGRWLVYSANPASDVRGGLVYNFKQYGLGYTGAAYAGPGTGNGFIYSVTPKVTVSLTGTTTKTYNGTTVASLAPSNFVTTGAIDGDTVIIGTPVSGVYADKNAGTGKVVSTTVASSSLSASNGIASVYGYQLANNSVSGNIGQITPAALTVTGTVASNKVYDGTQAAALTSGKISGVIAGDSVILSQSGTFVSKNVGTSIAVTATDSLGGTSAGNYTLVQPTGLVANITPRAISVAATGTNKVYDATVNDVVTLASTGVISGDTVNFADTSAAFADKNVANGKTVSVAGITASGADAGNYTLTNTTASTKANIMPLAISVAASGTNKVYDATVNDTVTLASSGVISGDKVSFADTSATFADKNVANGKTVSVKGISASGADAGNYALISSTASTTADITPLAIGVAATGTNKVYDATVNDAVKLASSGVISGDKVSFADTSATFADKNVANGKTVSVAGISASGTDAGNYTVNTTASTLANITPLAISVAATGTNKVYDATVNDVVTLASSGVISGDTVSFADTSATFANKNVANGKAVSVKGISAAGADAGNYTINTTASTSANITPLAISVAATGTDKVYDATVNDVVKLASSGVISGDKVSFADTSATFADKNVANGKTVSVAGISASGTDAGNYTLTNTTASTTANITPRAISVAATGTNKVYDATVNDAVTLASSGVISGDTVNFADTSATFADKNVANGKTVSVAGISASGTDAGNYTLTNTTASTKANITPLAISVAATGTNKVYDATVNDAVTLASSGVISGDTVNFADTSAAFADKNVANGKTVSVKGISASGTDAGNYKLTSTSASTTANITPLAIGVAATGTNKVYDATVNDVVKLASSGVISGDKVSFAGTSATFADKNVANGKTVSVVGISASGTDAGNYTLTNTTASTTANITPRAISVAATGANKVYDATVNDVVTLASSGVISGDTVNFADTSATFADKNVANGKTVSVAGISASGTDAGNYTLTNTTASTKANITPLAITGSVMAADKTYNGTTAATITTRALSGVLGSDAVSYSGGKATFSDKNAGTGKTVTATGLSLTGTDAKDYTVNTTASTTADINPATLTASISGTTTKVYDGTTAATIANSNYKLSGFVTGESATVNQTSGSYNSKDVASASTVSTTLTSANFTAKSGTLLSNYVLPTSASGTGKISAATLTFLANLASMTQGSAIPALSGSVIGFVLGDTLATATTGTVSWSTPATSLSRVGTYAINGGGLTANLGDYKFVQAPGNAKALTIMAPSP